MARRTAEEAEQTKQLIAATAERLFIQHGYQATSMEQIREQSGMSKGSIYYHFKSKELLFMYVLDLHLEQWIQAWYDSLVAGMSATDKMYALAEHFARDFNDPLLKAAEEFSLSNASNPEHLETLLMLTRKHFPVLKEVLTQGIQSGEFSTTFDVDRLTLYLYNLLAGLGVLSLEEEQSEAEIISMHRDAIRLFLGGVSRRS
ncbi:TetR/AcrR family transcriptional regulator [Paenibacillus sp. 481]|uniref:TetR/AcrR family transcriptional regulator n=1 Tax=Paenibacillus sp. 481 TaxID=2835869 RepID=UPI001E50D507|nr:TetR/AcrR family transcriptional regulator [Paenibacillus sp. 481]UHA72902.1 TetR family transcriptional regulator [Paenibacillus sp. 481]